ncbi:MAG: S-layer homology domain-containing protein [Candidatus Saganbacteria bacterium]|nr:S-layer homology domain-containing protein [Candidatus Saganbacteria bacterium]
MRQKNIKKTLELENRRLNASVSKKFSGDNLETATFSRRFPAVLIVICLVIVSWSLGFVSEVNAAALDPMKIGIGARTLAMGRTAVADAGDIDALFVNPANGAYLKQYGLTSMYTNLSEDMNYIFLGGANKFDFGTLGLAYLGSGASGFQGTTIESGRVVPTGSAFGYTSSVIALTYGKEFWKGLALGGSFKLFNKGFGVTNGSGSGYDVDLGLLWQPMDNLTIGAVQQNALPQSMAAIRWATNTAEDIPSATKLGVNYNPQKDLLLAGDLDLTSGQPMTLHGGVEWMAMENLALRGGLDQLATSSNSAAINYSFGVGLLYAGVSFDYAYYYDTTLASVNSAHYFSLSFVPLPPAPKSVEKPVPPQKPKPAPVATSKAVEPPKSVLALKTFSDVPNSYWAYKPIGTLGTLGILGGYPDGTFRPDDLVNRGQMAAILVRAKGETLEKVTAPVFSDVPLSSWTSPYIKKAVEMGWVKGYAGNKFEPENGISRAEAVMLLTRFDGMALKDGVSPFADITSKHWAAPAIAAAKDAGILDYLAGKKFEPNKLVTRAEISEMLSKTNYVKTLLPK